MKEPSPFINPWPDAARARESKLTAYVPSEVLGALKARRLVQGTQTIVINQLIKKLLHECERRNIIDFRDQQQFEQFVVNCQLALPGEVVTVSGGQSIQTPLPNGGSVASALGGPTTPPDTSSPVSNAGGGSAEANSPVGTEAPSSADVESRSGTGSGRKRAKGPSKGQGE